MFRFTLVSCLPVPVVLLICHMQLTAQQEVKPQTDAGEKKPDAKAALPEQAKRLGISKPAKTSKFETVKSKKFEKDEYDIVIDEKAATEAGFHPEEIKQALKQAMEARSDRRENNTITIEIDKQRDQNNPKPKEEPKLVGKIQKKEKPENAHQDSKTPAIKEMPIDKESIIRIKAEGACESQNKGTLEDVKFENPV